MNKKNKDIILTVWFDNTFGCANKCKFCYVSEPLVEELTFEHQGLHKFLELFHKDIFLVKILGQEPYVEKDVCDTLDILESYGISPSKFDFTTMATKKYPHILSRVEKITISCSGLRNHYYGFKSEKYPYKENIEYYLQNFGQKIEKINWIIGKFNLENLVSDLREFYKLAEDIDSSLQIPLGFLLQKGVIYSKQDISYFQSVIPELQKFLLSYRTDTFVNLAKQGKIYDTPLSDLDTRELTYCYNRKDSESWFRCPYEITDRELHLKEPFKYLLGIEGEDIGHCTQKCTYEKKQIQKGQTTFDIQKIDLFYFKVMLTLLNRIHIYQ